MPRGALGSLDTVMVMEHAATLFSGHIQLLQRFNRHLPEGYRIEMLTPSLREYTPCYALATLPTPAAEALADGFLRRIVRRRRRRRRKHTSET